jgi:hypothetical protein
MRGPESHTLLLHLAVKAKVAAFTQTQALSASVVLYPTFRMPVLMFMNI